MATVKRGLLVLLMLISACGLCLGAGAPKALTDDMRTIRDRVVAPYRLAPDDARLAELSEVFLIEFMPALPDAVAQLDEWCRTMRADGTWADVNYAGKSPKTWEPSFHLSRLLTMAYAWYRPESPLHNNDDLKARISRGLDVWYAKDLRRPWWWDAIGAPRYLSMTLLMFDDALTDAQRERSRKTVALVNARKKTGANTIWMAETTMRLAIVLRDADLMAKAVASAADELAICDPSKGYRADEGVQPDYSFYQHGQLLYNHAYGAHYASHGAHLMALTAGTAQAFPPEKVKLLANYVLDGSQLMCHNGSPDFSPRNRSVSRPGYHVRIRNEMRAAAEALLGASTGRDDDLKAMIARIDGDKDAAPIVRNKMFYRSDYMVHHRPGWYMSARAYSTRTMNTDSLIAGEGALSHFFGEGATCIMRHGNEYNDLFPVWDWHRVPGTTAEMAEFKPKSPKRRGVTDFVGGSSDDTVGAMVFQFKRDAVSGKKSWFFFTDSAVCLGNDIRCDSDLEVVTTLNQCRLFGPVVADGEAVPRGSRTLKAQWVWHDGIGYLLEQPADVLLANEARKGDWKTISKVKPSQPVEDNVFLLGLSHGVKPAGATYAYAVLPGVKADTMPALVAKPPYEIVANTPKLQAVYHPGDGALCMIFHTTDPLEWGEWHVKVDRPCALVIRNAGGAVTVRAADPAQKPGVVAIEARKGGGWSMKGGIRLNDGLHAGWPTGMVID